MCRRDRARGLAAATKLTEETSARDRPDATGGGPFELGGEHGGRTTAASARGGDVEFGASPDSIYLPTPAMQKTSFMEFAMYRIRRLISRYKHFVRYTAFAWLAIECEFDRSARS